MINQNELRVGNLVYDDENVVVKIEKISSDRHISWSESEKVEFSKIDDADNIFISNINPIIFLL